MSPHGRLTTLFLTEHDSQVATLRGLFAATPLSAVTLLQVSSVDEALTALKSAPVDLVCVLLEHHGADGIELIRQIRERDDATPIIALASRDRDLDLQAMRAGADNFLELEALTPEVVDVAVRYAVQIGRERSERRRSEELLRALVEHSSDAIILLDTNGRLTYATQSLRRLAGYEPSAALGADAFQAVHPDDAPGVRALFNRCLRDHPGNEVRTEFRIRDAFGKWRHWDVAAINHLVNPAIGAVLLTCRDISERKTRADDNLRYETMFEQSPVGLAHTTLAGRWERCNTRLLHMLGYDAEMLRALTFADITHPEDVAASVAGTRALLNGDSARHELEKRYRRADGTYMWTRVSVSMFRDDRGVPQHFIAAIEDISAHRELEDRLRSAMTRLQRLVASLPLAVWALDENGIVSFCDGKLLSRFGMSPGDLVGKSLLEPLAADQEALAVARRALSAEHVHETIKFRDGSFEIWYSPLWENDKFAGTLGIAIEVTERLRLESQVMQSQKMEAIGRLAGGVAHDFNNLLTAIIGHTEFALDGLPQSEARQDLEQVRKAAESAAGMTRQLLAFSRRQILQPQTVDLNAAVRKLASLLRRLIGEDVTLETTLASDLRSITVDPAQLEQVLLNLAINARDAMPDGGRLLIETANLVLDEPDPNPQGGVRSGAHVVLAVTDTGTGMDAATQKRVFEPFFTTKEAGKGTGLGLATVYGIVKQSGGYISVDSELGRGTTFKVFLPANKSDTSTLVAVSEEVTRVEGHETVLLVEDQREVRDVTSYALRRAGYRVLAAATPNDAISLARRTPEIDLLLTDVVMPQRNGRMLASELRRLLPQLKVIYTSGYAEDAIVQRHVLAPDVAFLPKPYTPTSLLSKVRAALDGTISSEL